MPENFIFRPIQQADNAQVAHIIRTVMTEYGAVGEGFSIMDPEVDHMYEAYQIPRAGMYVIEKAGRVLGCGGFGPLLGAETHICELKKMYFLPELRGLGFGKKVVMQSFEEARKAGYTHCYLETLLYMEPANTLYRKLGFQVLDGPTGATGHGSCDAWYLIQL
ncbi:MAG: GNAT family N-acetyltransferase [Saprospirales bacterium]|nr:GNAT family N-acetyltransferase [Saprospirales bacterium]